jgi:hypothetical protein
MPWQITCRDESSCRTLVAPCFPPPPRVCLAFAVEIALFLGSATLSDVLACWNYQITGI